MTAAVLNGDLEALRCFVAELLDELLRHDGFSSFKVEIRILKRGQKEVIVDCGRQHRFVVDCEPSVRRSP